MFLCSFWNVVKINILQEKEMKKYTNDDNYNSINYNKNKYKNYSWGISLNHFM